ncbi:MAG: MOSC domain-containing protein [Gammaproteobacteria bacterium]|nr:MOSC domain-containing protein [Gammaproteobacteria bacterium]
MATTEGFSGDAQGDRINHGGADKAIHHYPADHYPYWAARFPEEQQESANSGWEIGGFGENISSLGLTEADLCIGDTLQLGKAIVQVSQARQPCWKLNQRFGYPQMAEATQESGRTGWYYRVLQEGEVSATDNLTLLSRPCPDWSLEKLLHYLYVDPLNHDALTAIANLAPLAESWKKIARNRLSYHSIEPWQQRLQG